MSNRYRILLIQTAFIGDVVLSTPLPRALKELYSDSEIDILLIPKTEIVYRYDPHINNIFIFDKKDGLWRKLLSFLTLIRKFRNQRYDIALSVHVSITSSLLMLFGGAKTRIGYPRQRFTTVSVPFKPGYPMYKRSLLLLKALTIREFSTPTELHIPPKAVDLISGFLAEQALEADRLVAIAPSSVWATKRWLPEYYAQVIIYLETRGWNCVLIGEECDRELCGQIKQASRTSVSIAAGLFDLITSAELIKRSRILICNDSGPLHIANAVQTPVLGIFGPTSTTTGFFPYRPCDRVVELDLYCRPCGKHGHQKCPEGHFRCMRELTPEIVLQNIMEMLSEVCVEDISGYLSKGSEAR